MGIGFGRLGGLFHRAHEGESRQERDNADRGRDSVPSGAAGGTPLPVPSGRGSFLQKLHRRNRQETSSPGLEPLQAAQYGNQIEARLNSEIKQFFSSKTADGSLSIDIAKKLFEQLEKQMHGEVDQRVDSELAAIKKLGKLSKRPAKLEADRAGLHSRIDEFMKDARQVFNPSHNGALIPRALKQPLRQLDKEVRAGINERFDREIAAIGKSGKLNKRPALLEQKRIDAHQRAGAALRGAHKLAQYLPYRFADQAQLGSGAYGSVHLIVDENGKRFSGKMLNPKVNPKRLDREYAAFQKIRSMEQQNNLPPHPNVLHAHGITMVPVNGMLTRMLVTDYVPGADGSSTHRALRHYWESGKISSTEYWGAVQFLTQRLLGAVEHLAEAGVVHGDVKNDNFVVNEVTGEPVLIDPGSWIAKGDASNGGNWKYIAPEIVNRLPADERADVFGIGVATVHAVDKDRRPVIWDPLSQDVISMPYSEGVFRGGVLTGDLQGKFSTVRTNQAETSYTKFADALLEKRRYYRPAPQEASELPFLADRMLDDDASREVIKKVLKMRKEEASAQKPAEKQDYEREWEQTLAFVEQRASMEAFRAVPTLARFAKLYKDAASSPWLQAQLNSGSVADALPKIEQQALQKADALLTAITRDFSNLPTIAGKVPARTDSDVDAQGVRLNKDDGSLSTDVVRLRNELHARLPAESLARLRAFRQQAESLLGDVSELRPRDTTLAKALEDLRAHSAAAMDVMDFLERHPLPVAPFKTRAGDFKKLYEELTMEHRDRKETVRDAYALLKPVIDEFPDLLTIAAELPARVVSDVNAQGERLNKIEDLPPGLVRLRDELHAGLPAESLERLQVFREQAEGLLKIVAELWPQDEMLGRGLEDLRAGSAAVMNILDFLERHPAPVPRPAGSSDAQETS